jgi:predicted phosphate transport protein (TIGR00153 family)
MFQKKTDTDFFKLLLESADNTLVAAKMFREAMSGNKPPVDYMDALRELEHKGDNITHMIYRGLNKVFITPLDREDIMDLANSMDDVIDYIEETIARFDYLNINYSDDFMKQFAEVIVGACEHIVQAFQLLSKKKYDQISEHTVKINSFENEGDRLMREGIRKIFREQKDPYTDFKIKELYECLEKATDACEDVANILESIILRYA